MDFATLSNGRQAMSLLSATHTPAAIDAILSIPWLWVLARAGLTSAYWIGGLAKALNWRAAVAESVSFHLRPARLITALTILVELGGSALVVSNIFVWLGAGIFGVFTLRASLIAYPFWRSNSPNRMTMLNSFCEHLGLISGFVLVAMVAALKQIP
jgi:uncharacterized membrane protein YphA (DoxX/SURF4 family)